MRRAPGALTPRRKSEKLIDMPEPGSSNWAQMFKISKISSEDEKVIQALQELGFERTDTYYEMATEP